MDVRTAYLVKMKGTFLLRSYMPDWRDDHDLDVAMRVLEALFEDFDVSFEGERVGDCTCPPPDYEELVLGEEPKTDPACPWHGSGGDDG